MKDFYKRFCEEGFNDKGILNHFEFTNKDDFNFSYDVIDEIAKREPNRRALVWCNVEGEEKQFTYGELSKYSNMAANLLLSKE